ncbi:MAG TPA: hypothetical protein VI316_10390 [Candidatus Dormibacteraeota bacterium]
MTQQPAYHDQLASIAQCTNREGVAKGVGARTLIANARAPGAASDYAPDCSRGEPAPWQRGGRPVVRPEERSPAAGPLAGSEVLAQEPGDVGLDRHGTTAGAASPADAKDSAPLALLHEVGDVERDQLTDTQASPDEEGEKCPIPRGVRRDEEPGDLTLCQGGGDAGVSTAWRLQRGVGDGAAQTVRTDVCRPPQEAAERRERLPLHRP